MENTIFLGCQYGLALAACLCSPLAGEEITQETSGMSKGEWREFEATLRG